MALMHYIPKGAQYDCGSISMGHMLGFTTQLHVFAEDDVYTAPEGFATFRLYGEKWGAWEGGTMTVCIDDVFSANHDWRDHHPHAARFDTNVPPVEMTTRNKKQTAYLKKMLATRPHFTFTVKCRTCMTQIYGHDATEAIQCIEAHSGHATWIDTHRDADRICRRTDDHTHFGRMDPRLAPGPNKERTAAQTDMDREP